MNDGVARKKILKSFLENIFGISSKEYQKRIWIEGRGPECDNFDDTACDFFEDVGPIIERYKDFDLTDRQYHLLLKFRDEFDDFIKGPRPYLPQDFIDTPEWERIMEMAKEVLREFNYQKIF